MLAIFLKVERIVHCIEATARHGECNHRERHVPQLLRDLFWLRTATFTSEPKDKRDQNEDVLGPVAGSEEAERSGEHAPSLSESAGAFIPKLPQEGVRSSGNS